MVSGVGSEEEGDLLEGCECRAGKGVISEQVGEAGQYRQSRRGAVGARKDDVDLVAEGKERAGGA